MTQRHRRRPAVRVLLAVAALVGSLGAAGGAGVLASPASAATGPLMLNTPKSLGGWGVTGYDGSTSPVTTFKSNVTALAEWNGRIYVGGMFTTVARNGVAQAAQPYLAAFDRTTGAWVSTFRPKLDGGVWDLVVTPAGRLIVGGYFATVNNQPRPAIVSLDPSNGFIDHSFAAVPSRTTGRVGVRTLELRGTSLYAGGSISKVTWTSGTTTKTVTGQNLFKLDPKTGNPNATFRPRLSTAPWDVYASPAGDRIYAAGKFGTVNGTAKEVLAVLSPTDGSLVPGVAKVAPTYDCRPFCTAAPYSMAVRETADRAFVVATPTEHGLHQLTRATLARRYGHYTGAAPGAFTAAGGDFQALTESGGVVYASCHCFKYDYSGAYTTNRPAFAPASWDRYSRINGIGAYDATTFAKIDTFTPAMYGQYGDGVWELMIDSTGCMWAGGDIVKTAAGGFLGGFAKFCTT